MGDSLTLDAWARMSAAERETRARAIARALPDGFALEGIQAQRCGLVANHVAQFRYEGATFSLVPGGEIVLGYDDAGAWTPAGDEAESWRRTSSELGLEESMSDVISRLTLRPRTAHLDAVLIETEARELGWRALSPDDPEARRYVEELGHRARGVLTVHDKHGITRLVRRDVGLVVERAEELFHTDLTAHIAKAGFRFPTSDEWEHACGAGAPTLFRWGDHAPCDRYPTDISPAEAAWRRRWALSGGKLQPPVGGFSADWDLHRRPNALGLLMAYDPYRMELTSEAHLTRGGDGGGRVCGGDGFFMAWLTLATAFFDPRSSVRDPDAPITPGYTVGRRVLPLS